MAIGGVVINFTARTRDAVQDVSKFVRELGKVDGAAKKTSTVLRKGLAVGAAAAGAGLLAAGAAAVKFAEGAIDDADSAAKLAKALKNTTKATDDQVAALEDWIGQQGIAYGFADDKLRPAITRLSRSTKDLTEAQELTTLAMDISGATGKDLETVANALAKANDGQIGSLKKLGLTLGNSAENAIEYNKAQTKMSTLMAQAKTALEEYGPTSKQYINAQAKVAEQQKSINKLASDGIDWQAELGKSMEGSAETAAGTVKGTWERVKLIFGEIGESLGQFVIPLLTDLGDWFKEKKNQKAVQDFINKLGDMSTELGERLVPKLQAFYGWVSSKEGQENLRTWGKAAADTAKAFAVLAESIAKVVGWYMKLPSWMRTNPISGLMDHWEDRPWNKPNDTRVNPPTTLDKGKLMPSSATSSSSVTIINNYPKPETSSSNLAASLRLARYGPP